MKFLDRSLAQEIVDRTMKIIKWNINVMDDNGIIIGSGDRSRIDSIHEGAMKVLEDGEGYEISETEAKQMQGVKAGINLPITFQEKVVGVIGITGPPEEIRSFGELVKMTAEMILQQAVLLEQMQWDERLKEELLSQLLHSPESLNSLYFERMRRLGIDLDIPRVAVILTAINRPLAFKVLRDKFEKEDLYVMYPDYLVLLKKVRLRNSLWDSASIVTEMEKWMTSMEAYHGLRCKMSIGSYHKTIEGVAESYREAVITQQVGEKLHPCKSLYLFEHYKLPAFLARANALGIGEVIGPYYQQLKQNDKKGELIETLLAYVEEDGDIHAVTGRLYIHRNTLRYRLDRIAELTGKDPRKVKELLELYLSVLQEQIT